MSVIIIGGGLAGLTAANYLEKAGVDYQLLEATERVGGRVKTDEIDGFLLDRGFQVLLTAYPEAQQLLNYKALELRTFAPGAALLLADGSIDIIGDPMRDLSTLVPTLRAKAGSLADKFRILNLRRQVKQKSVDTLFEQEEHPTYVALQNEYGFSEKMIERFFQPFFSGIFLEKELDTSRRMFDFVFKMFAKGMAAVPNNGMEAIPRQLANNLPAERIHVNTPVAKIEGNTVITQSGDKMKADKIILATEATSLVKEYHPTTNQEYVSTWHLHFTSTTPPIAEPLIGLNTTKDRLVNNICTISRVASGYAPAGQELISISVVGDPNIAPEKMADRVRKEMRHWFGSQVDSWGHLYTHFVRYALPRQQKVQHGISTEKLQISDHIYLCGDHLLNGSIDGAMKSGRLVAEAVTGKKA